ncbi:MAG: DUF4129 domain-containing protein [Deltaproteobacteria bacterium]|nr:DUF4129 domain-containing protein [Deltaproteobacteria bacterium]
MKSRAHILLMTASGTMMVSCYYACTAFILAGISKKPLPAAEAAAILFLATVITGIHSHRGWRGVHVAGLHMSGLLFSSLLLFHSYYRLESPFRHSGWVLDFFLLDRTITGWLFLVLLFFCVCFLWFCGIRLWIRPTDRTTLSHRFDLGLACLLVLLLVKLLIAVKGGTLPMAHSSTIPLLAFFIPGLFSMGLVRTQNTSRTGEITCFRGAGVVLGFPLIILLLGGGLFILFSPELQTFAEAGGGLFGTLARPIERMVLAMARFFLESGYRLKLGADSSTDSPPALPAMEGTAVSEIVVHLVTGLTIAILLATIGLLLYFLLKWLYKRLVSKTIKGDDRPSLWALTGLFVAAVKYFFASLLRRMHLIPDTSCIADKFYQRLLRWGRLSGLDHDVAETPKEYGIRLERRFPQLKKEIRLIILVHDEAIYGGITPDGHQVSAAKFALRRIRNPLLWFSRIKSFYFQNHY